MNGKSLGVTATERILAKLCDQTFLRLWSYANPFRKPGTELCDVIAVLDNDVFLFFDREVRKFDDAKDLELAWERWHRKVITAQIATAKGARRHIANGGNIFLDSECKSRIPLPVDRSKLHIHLIIVAHGAKEACKAFSGENVYGSMAIKYEAGTSAATFPFLIPLDKEDPVHVLDSHNLEIILGELDTIADLSDYLQEKERAIEKYDGLVYAGEEDLLAHYLLNFDPKSQGYRIGPRDGKYNFVLIGEGEWADFVKSPQYQAQKEANKDSYLWDNLIQKTSQHMLDGTGLGNTNPFGPSAVREMAKERRLARRAIAKGIIEAIQTFPNDELGEDGLQRKMTFCTSLDETKGYIFLQIRKTQIPDYAEYRQVRQNLLNIACGSAKNRFPKLDKVVGIAIDAPKFVKSNSEDLILLECSNWSDEDRNVYEQANEELGFFETNNPQKHRKFTDFPVSKAKPGRNDRCHCGSGKKYKNATARLCQPLSGRIIEPTMDARPMVNDKSLDHPLVAQAILDLQMMDWYIPGYDVYSR